MLNNPQIKSAVPIGGTINSPLTAFCLWIIVCAVLFGLGWSDRFAAYRWDTGLFLAISSVMFWFVARTFKVPQVERNSVPVRGWVATCITAYFAVAYAANGGVPVVQIIAGRPNDIYSFGIEGLHVLLLTFTGYYGVRAFRHVLESGDRIALSIFLWIVLLLVSTANRSALSFLFFACAILYLRAHRLRPVQLVALLVVVATFLSAFGQFGSTRLSHQISQDTQKSATGEEILAYAGANDDFRRTGIPSYWLWPYFYLASPLANLNEGFEYSESTMCGRNCDLVGLAVYELVPDVLGARVAEVFDVQEFDKQEFIISRDVTAATAFGSAVGYAGLVGASIVLLELLVLSMLILRYLRFTRYHEEGVALLATVLFFSFFENMIAYSALFLQLAWVLLAVRGAKARRLKCMT